ncbi:hypothetical protein PsYK624_028640 [Phanerochaete sordida]|uniref:Uncharacterized protein n=1 Tax=Phanerochaete sordida TaxID=48140 RepID=A0A9P3G0L4_9APHY|nr:hypothetical protein PsYK624_028640 [Phanerochaete sordida]
MYSPLVYARSQSAGAARPPVLTGTWIGLVWHGMVRFGWVDTIESTARSTGNVYLGVKMSADAGDGRLLVVVPISHVWVHTLKIGYCDKGHMQLADPLGVSFDKHCHVYPSEVWTAPNWIVPNPKVCHWACYLGYHPVLHPAFDARAVDVPADVRTTHELIEYVYPVFAKFNVSRDEVVAYIYSDDFMKLAADIARSLERECVYVGRPSSAA